MAQTSIFVCTLESSCGSSNERSQGPATSELDDSPCMGVVKNSVNERRNQYRHATSLGEVYWLQYQDFGLEKDHIGVHQTNSESGRLCCMTCLSPVM